MFRKILYPTDFSEGANNALKYIIKLKEAGTEEVLILNVIHGLELESIRAGCIRTGLVTEEVMADIYGDAIKNETKKAEKILKEIKAEGLKGSILVEVGDPTSRILKISNENNVSLIVMGAYGKNKNIEFLVGSVTEKVYRHAKVPVLVVR